MSETVGIPPAGESRADPQMEGLVCELKDDGLGAARVNVADELLDLRKLTFLDSCGLRVVMYASRRAKRAGDLRGPSQVQRLLALSGFADAVKVANQPAWG